MALLNFMKTAKPQEAKQQAKPQDTPNNETAELQDAPIYGPPTEKEYWQAIKQAAETAKAQVWAKHEEDTANLPAKPDYRGPFEAWMQEHHPDVVAGYAAITNDNRILLAEERQIYRKRMIQPLLQEWASTDPVGIKLNEQHRQRMSASEALDQQRDNALKAILKDFFEADGRLRAIAEEERRRKREAQYEERMRLEQEAKRERLMEEIGAELVRELNVEHPDFDREAFEQMCQCKDPGHINFNVLGYGPTGTGKSRAMAHQALQIVEWCIDCVWVDSATFAGLVTACAPDASSAQRKEARAELKRLAEVEFLFFDDLGAVRFTESRITHFYALMQARYKHNLTTYFTTNYDREGIEKMLTVEGTRQRWKPRAGSSGA
jgi:DNA replication protein DnaC